MKDWLAWWNAIYWVPLALSLLWNLGSAVGSELGGDSSGEDDCGGDADASGECDDAGDFGLRLKDAFGLGRVSITTLIGVAGLIWGTFGIAFNLVGEQQGLPPARLIPLSLIVTAIATALATRLMVELLARYSPSTETFAITDTDLIGREGRVVYQVAELTGTVQVTDRYGTLHRRMARLEPHTEAINANCPILVVGFDPDTRRLIVRKQLSAELGSVSIKIGEGSN